MMPHDRHTAIAVMIALLVPVMTGPVTAGTRLCDQKAARQLVGKIKPTDKTARRLTRAAIVRQIAPGDPVTLDLRRDRITIETDPATGRVVRAACG